MAEVWMSATNDRERQTQNDGVVYALCLTQTDNKHSSSLRRTSIAVRLLFGRIE